VTGQPIRVDLFEVVFDYGLVTVTPIRSTRDAEQRLAQVQELRQRVQRMQGAATSQPLPTHPALAELVRLRTGASYAVDRPALAMALMSEASGAGAWSAVIGVPDFGLEAASGLGVDLERTVLVPEPGDAWVEVTAALIDVLQIVVVRPRGRVTQHQAARLSSRLRQRDAVLLAVGDWPRPEARLAVRRSDWSGIGHGHGRLVAHRASVVADLNTGGRREVDLWLPGPDQELRVAARADGQADGLYVVRAG
jgi:hypothetical protein